MESAVSARSRHARRLFAGIALSYERVATLLSLGQDPRWRRALAAAICANHICWRRAPRMVVLLVRAQGERVPFADESFDM